MDRPESWRDLRAIVRRQRTGSFDPPWCVKFYEALNYIEKDKPFFARVVVTIDQPTIVPHTSGMRPAGRIAASLLPYTGGGVQPASRGRSIMFGTGSTTRRR